MFLVNKQNTKKNIPLFSSTAFRSPRPTLCVRVRWFKTKIQMIKKRKLNCYKKKKPGEWLRSASECVSFEACGPREWTVEEGKNGKETEWTITKKHRVKMILYVSTSPHFHRVRYSLVLVWQSSLAFTFQSNFYLWLFLAVATTHRFLFLPRVLDLLTLFCVILTSLFFNGIELTFVNSLLNIFVVRYTS